MIRRSLKILCIITSCSILLGAETETSQSFMQSLKKNKWYVALLGCIGIGIAYKLIQNKKKHRAPQPKIKKDKQRKSLKQDLKEQTGSIEPKEQSKHRLQEIFENLKEENEPNRPTRLSLEATKVLDILNNNMMTDKMLGIVERGEIAQKEGKKDIPSFDTLIRRFQIKKYQAKKESKSRQNNDTIIAQLCDELKIASKDPFQILGLSSNASSQEIEDRFNEQAASLYTTNKNSTEHKKTFNRFRLLKACKEQCLKIKRNQALGIKGAENA